MEFLLQLLAELFPSVSPEEINSNIMPVQKEAVTAEEPVQASKEVPVEDDLAGFFGVMQFH